MRRMMFSFRGGYKTLAQTLERELAELQQAHEELEKRESLFSDFWERVKETLFEGYIDGFFIQECAEEIGLLRLETYDPEGRHREIVCYELEAGDDIYIDALMWPKEKLDEEERKAKAIAAPIPPGAHTSE